MKHIPRITIAHVVPTLSLGGVRRYIGQISENTSESFTHLAIPIFAHPDRPLLAIPNVQVLPLNFSIAQFNDRDAIALALTNTFRECAVNLVHSHHLYADIYTLLAAGVGGIPAIRTVHGILQVSTEDQFRKTTVRYDWSPTEIDTELALEVNCSLSICVSREVREKLVLYGIPANKTRLIHNGVDCEKFDLIPRDRYSSTRANQQLSQDTFVVGFLGRFEPSKNVLSLVDIAAALKRQVQHPFVFLLQGEGPQEGILKQAICSTGLIDHFRFQPASEIVRPFFAAIDTMIVPSHAEGCPFVLLEAMASGIPVLASTVGAIPEIVREQVEGFLFPPMRPASEVAHQLAQLIPEGARQEIGTRARNRILSAFNVRDKIAEVEQIYKAVTLGGLCK